MTEAERRALWCTQQAQWSAAERARLAALRAPTAPAQAVRANWQPVLDWRREQETTA